MDVILSIIVIGALLEAARSAARTGLLEPWSPAEGDAIREAITGRR